MSVFNKISFAVFMMFSHVLAFAEQDFKLDDIKGTSGAGTKNLTDLTVRGAETAQSFVNLVLIVFCFIGVFIFALSLVGLYKAGKEDRESPKGAIIGLVIGGCLTAVTVLLGYTRNTLGV